MSRDADANGMFSRLMLGTAQFGMAYGIAGPGRQPAYATCRDIVAAALDAGITAFDTAAAYGNSEQVLGRALAELGAADRVAIVSKCAPIGAAVAPERAAAAIETSLRRSLRNLRVAALAALLFHREEDQIWLADLARLRESGRVRRIGLSVDTVAGAREAADDRVEAVQLPHNLFDRRFSNGPLFEGLQRRGVRLFARSAFLQGLLLMPEARIPAHLAATIPPRRRLQALARAAGMDMPELCLRYSLSEPAITSVLIGVDTAAQLRENAAILARGPLDAGLRKAIAACVPDFPEAVVRPRCWPRREEGGREAGRG